MIKTILFDFDGVILDSMKIKGDGFVELFKGYPESAIKQLESYHYTNGGISRFEKIRYFFNTVLKKEILEEDVQDLAKKFSMIIEKNLYNKDNLIEDSVDFIKKNYQNYTFHIVSAAENNELNKLCQYLNLLGYFITVEGSPTKKTILVKNIIDKYHYNKNETILIGDSLSDFETANENELAFWGYNNEDLRDRSDKYIDSFKSLDSVSF